MRAGGREALLHTFLTYDLTGFNILAVPKTAALAEQKDRNLRGPYKWIREVLTTGQLGIVELSEDTRTAISKQEVSAAYARDNKYEKYSPQSGALAKAIRKTMGNAVIEERPRVKDEAGKWTRGKWEFSFAPLPELRRAFERFYGQPVRWNDEQVVNPFEE
jgi:hypothetical protein